MSVAATAGAAAWVVPEILTAKPAAGATLSVGPTLTGTPPPPETPPSGTPTGTSTSSGPATSPATTSDGGSGSTAGTLTSTGSPASSPATSSGTLAFTGIDIQRDAEIGAALVAGGWAMHHWASRTPKPATEAVTEAHQAGSQVDPT